MSADIVVVGATGAVGLEVLSILAARGVAAARVRGVASDRSAGKPVPYGPNATITVEPLADSSLAGARCAIFATDAAVSRAWCPKAVGAGAVVIDNSSAFRMDRDVSLVVPEINGDELAAGESHRARIIANPNCSAAILLMALDPLRRAFGVEGVVVATYQAVSGAGIAAMDELRTQTSRVLAGENASPSVFHEPIAFNLFSHDSAVDPESGLNGEERKIIDECRKIWGDPGLRVTPTCVRVPVLRAHTQAATVTLRTPATIDALRGAYDGAKGVRVIDDRAANRFPTPLKAAGVDDVLVGRLRPDPCERADPDGRLRTFCLLIAGDQLRKGAALNAVQIADALGLVR